MNSLMKVIVDTQNMQEHLRSSGLFKVMANAQRMKEQLQSLGLFRLIADTQKMQERFWSSSLFDAMADAQRMKEQLQSSGLFRLMADTQKMQDRLWSSGLFEAMTAVQKMKEQLQSSGLFRLMADTQKMQEHFSASIITRLTEISENLRDVEFEINPDGTISGRNASLNITEVETAIENCIINTPISEQISFEQTLNSFLNNVAKKHPIISKIIVYLIVSLLPGVFIAKYFPTTPQVDYSRLARQLKKEIRQVTVNKDIYTYYRFVKASSLIVRSSDSIKSRSMGKLYFGQLVRVIHKKKNWSLIEYHDKENAVIIRGWVFTRYIKKFD